MRRLEDLAPAAAHVHRGHDHAVPGVPQALVAQLLLQDGPQGLAAVLRPHHGAAQIEQAAQRPRRQLARREHGRPLTDEHRDQALHRHFIGQRQREQAADGGARQQVEAPGQRLADAGFQPGQHDGGVQAEKAAARQRQHTHAGPVLQGGEFHGARLTQGQPPRLDATQLLARMPSTLRPGAQGLARLSGAQASRRGCGGCGWPSWVARVFMPS
jgi:hypothetical protein